MSIFRLKFEKAIVILEISTLEFIQIPKIEQNNNNDNSNNKKWNQNCLICVFWPVNCKNYCYIWNQHPPVCWNAKNCSKQKKKEIWDQKCLIWTFWAELLKSYWYIWNQLPRICQNAKFRAKIKILKGTLMQIWQSAILSSSYESNMLKISHWNTLYFLRYEHMRYVKSLFTNIQKTIQYIKN